MMKDWKAKTSMVLYCLALAISAMGTLWIVVVHLDLWRAGKFIIGPFVALWVIEYVTLSLVVWVFARWLHGRKLWNRAFAVTTATPFVLLVVMRSQDWVG